MAVTDREAVETTEDGRSREGVQAAKVVLGERRTPRWEQTDAERRARWPAEVPEPDPR